jgi:cysteinyl-tRNA synthetase
MVEVMNDKEIDTLVAARDKARKAHDYATADAIRDQLLSLRSGYLRLALLDEPNGTFWYWTSGDQA